MAADACTFEGSPCLYGASSSADYGEARETGREAQRGGTVKRNCNKSSDNPVIKLRFIDNGDSYNVMARRKSTAKWEKIATCHYTAKKYIRQGRYELLQWNISTGNIERKA